MRFITVYLASGTNRKNPLTSCSKGFKFFNHFVSVLANVSACYVWLKLLLQTPPCPWPFQSLWPQHCVLFNILEWCLQMSIKIPVPILFRVIQSEYFFQMSGLRDWNEMFAVRFVCFVLLTDCDHQGAVVLHNCTLSYMSYGTEVMFQSSDVVCMCIVFGQLAM